MEHLKVMVNKGDVAVAETYKVSNWGSSRTLKIFTPVCMMLSLMTLNAQWI